MLIMKQVHRIIWINWFALLHYHQNISKHDVENKQYCMSKDTASQCSSFKRFQFLGSMYRLLFYGPSWTDRFGSWISVVDKLMHKPLYFPKNLNIFFCAQVDIYVKAVYNTCKTFACNLSNCMLDRQVL